MIFHSNSAIIIARCCYKVIFLLLIKPKYDNTET